MKEFNIGDRVRYQWTHWMNSVSNTKRTKDGVFIGLAKFNGWDKKIAIVHFDKNKNPSRVSLDQLRLI